MIEINLLPLSKRVPEGTPPLRMAVILGSVMFTFVGLLLSFKYSLDEKGVRKDIENIQSTIKTYEEELEEIKNLKAEIAAAQSKLNVIKNLQSNRLKWNRLLFRIAQVFNNQAFEFATLEQLSFKRKGPKVDITLTGWITAGIKNPAEEKEEGYFTRLYREGWKIKAALRYYTGSYQTYVLKAEELKKDKDLVAELSEINKFLDGRFSQWSTKTLEPANFRPNRLPNAMEGYQWVLPKRALSFTFATTFTQKQPPKPKSKKRGKKR